MLGLAAHVLQSVAEAPLLEVQAAGDRDGDRELILTEADAEIHAQSNHKIHRPAAVLELDLAIKGKHDLNPWAELNVELDANLGVHLGDPVERLLNPVFEVHLAQLIKVAILVAVSAGCIVAVSRSRGQLRGLRFQKCRIEFLFSLEPGEGAVLASLRP